MAEENQNLTESISMPEGNIQENPQSQMMSRDVMQGTPDDAINNWDQLKDELIDGSEPTGEVPIEGLEQAVALHNMVRKYPVSTAPRLKPTDADINKEVFGSVISDVISREGNNMPNEIQPVRFSVKGSNFDRYYNHPKFKDIGFHPYANNELSYNEQSTWWDENARMRTQFSKVFRTGFMSTYNAIGDFASGDYMRPDIESAEAFADAMRIGNSTQEGTGAFFNNLMLNSGYTVGIMSNIAVEELALAGLELATFGGATPLVASRTAYNSIRGAKAIDKMFDVGAYADKSRSLLSSMKNVDWAKDFWGKGGRFLGNALTPSTYKAIKSINTVQNSAAGLSNMAKVAKTFGGFYRDVRAVNLAMAESKLEGGMVKNDLVTELYREFVDEHGRAPIGDELTKIVNKGDEAGFTTIMMNAPLIFFSNALVFDTMLRGFKGTGALLAAAQKGVGSRILKSTSKQMAKDGTKAFYDGGKTQFRRFMNKGFSGNLKTFAGSALNYGKLNFVEGFQELAQEAIAVGAKDYYYNLYKDPMANGIDAAMASTLAGAKSQMSGEGFEVFMSGFLMGGLVQGPQKLVFEKGPELYEKYKDPKAFEEYQKQKDDYINNTVDVLNKVYENPEEFFQADRIQALTQKETNESLFSSSFAEDARSFMDKKDAGLFHALYTVLHAGKMQEFKGQMEDYLKLDEQGLAEAFENATPEEIKSGKTRERVQGMLDRMDDVEKAYNDLNDKIVNPFVPSNYKRGTKEHIQEVISSQAFDHAKMLSMFTRNTFERALERSNQIYTDLASDPIISKMAANDISVLADTPQLISEIRLLKIELKNMTAPVAGEKIVLSGEEKSIHDKKKERLTLLQDYFATLTDPNNIEKYDEVKGEESVESSKKEEAEFNRIVTIVTGDAVKKVRNNILSNSLITDQESEDLIKYESGSANPFGIFDTDNMDKLESATMNFLNHLSGESKEAFIEYDKLKDTLNKLVDYKSLKGRSEDYNRAIKTIINPSSLTSLSDKIAVKFKELYMENKVLVKDRMKGHVEQKEKIDFLNQLAEYGIYPIEQQVEVFLKGGDAPKYYYSEDGVLTPETNLELYEKKDELLGTYLNMSGNKVQEDKKAKDKKEDKKEEVDPYNFENTHFEQNPTDHGIQEEGLGKYTGNTYGDSFLVKKHKEYILNQENSKSKGKVLVELAEWLANPISKQARIIEMAISRIYDEVYVEEKLLGTSEDTFYGWLSSMKSDPKITDILRSLNITISDILDPQSINIDEFIEETVDDGENKIKSRKNNNYKVKKETQRDNDTGENFDTYIITDLNDVSVDDKIYTNKAKADTAKRTLEKKKKNATANNVPFPFADTTYKRGDILENKESGDRYMVFSTPAMVETNNNIYIKRLEKAKSNRSKDKHFLDVSAFKTMNLEKVSEDILDYKTTTSKLKVNEPLVIFPIRDYSIKNDDDRIQESKVRLQTVLRNLTPEESDKITFRVSPGSEWFKAEEKPVEDKKDFEEYAGAIKNDLIKKHGQKWQVEVQLYGKTIGFFQGPTTLKLLNRSGEVINPTEITEAQVQDRFKVGLDEIKEKTQEIRNNYFQSYAIYDAIDNEMKGVDGAKTLTKEQLGVKLNISEGAMALSEPGEGVAFKDLDVKSINFVSEEDLIDKNEKPYFVLDYNRVYKDSSTSSKENVEYSVITNIKVNSPSWKKLKQEIRTYETKFKPSERLGKYVAFVSLPNGRSAFIPLLPATMSETEVTSLFTELQNKSIETVDKNIDNKIIVLDTFNESFNKKLQDKLFISSTRGIYMEIKISNNGDLRIDYSDLAIEKGEKLQKAKSIMPAAKFQEMNDIEEITDYINKELFGKASPIEGKANVTLDNFKHSIPKNTTIADINNMSTSLDKEVKKDFNFTLSSTESIKVIRRKVAKSEELRIAKEAEDMSASEKIEAYETDFSNVPTEILEGIAKKQAARKDLTDLEEKIASFNSATISSLRLHYETRPETQSNLEGEKENQENVLSINELTQKVKDRKKEIRSETRSNPKNAEKTNKEINEINKSLILSDIKLRNLAGLLKVAMSKANKIIKGFDGHDVEDIETFTRWVQDNLPADIRVNVEDLAKKLKSGYITVGQFYMQMKNISKGILGLEGVITVAENSPFKYHEAFHSVFRMLLTDTEITKYIKLAKTEVRAKLRAEGKTIDQALQEMRRQHLMYAEMSNTQLEERLYEEHLADEFDKFKMNPSSSNTNSENKSMFARIIDFIIEILRNFKTRKLNHLFEGIDSGKYKNASIQENRFTQSFDGNVAYKLELFDPKFIKRTGRDGSSKIKQVKNYIPADQVQEIVSGIANLQVSRLDKVKGPVNANALLDETIADWIEMYNPDRDFYVDRGQWFDDNVDELTLVYESLLEQVDDLKDLVTRNLSEFSPDSLSSIEDADYNEQDQKSVGDYDKTADMIGGYAGLPKRIKHFIATTTIEEEDRYGNKYVNKETNEPIIVAVNPNNVYNGLLKVLANTSTDLEMFKKAWVFSKNNRHTKAVIDRLFQEIGIYEFASSNIETKGENATISEMMNGSELPSQVNNSSLYLAFTKGFRKYRVDNIFAHTDTDTGITHLYAANKKDDAHVTVQQWAEDFNRRYARLKLKNSLENEEVRDAFTSLISLLKLTNIPEGYNLNEEISTITETLRQVAGMNIHENYILYSVYENLGSLTKEQEIVYETYKTTEPIEVEAISHIRQSLASGENLYLDNQTVFETEGDTDVKYEKGGVKGRLKKLALNNAKFDESVGASTFIDAEGNRRYAHQDPTLHLQKIAEMDNVEYISDKLKEDVYFEKNMLLNNPQFKLMVAAGQVRALRIVGSKEEALMLGDQGLTTQKGRTIKGKGVSFGKSTPREFALDLIHTYLFNYNRVAPKNTMTGGNLDDNNVFAISTSNIRVIEAANTGDFVALPVHKMLDRNVEGIEISEFALNKFENEIRIEFDRARRYYVQEQEGIENTYENKERLGRLHTTYTLLTKLISRKRSVQAKLPKIGKDQRASITDGKQSIAISNTSDAMYSNLSQGENATVDIDGESFIMTHQGRKSWNDLTAEEQTKMIENYYPSVSTIKNEDKPQHEADINGMTYYTYNYQTAQFFRGNQDMVIFSFERTEEVEEVDTKLTESKETGELIVEDYDVDLTVVEKLEKAAKTGRTDVKEEDLFDTVFAEVEGRKIVKQRLGDEINEFILALKEIKAYNKVSKELSVGLGEYVKVKKGKDTGYDSSDSKYFMDLYNLKTDDVDFNLAQVYLNNYINTKSFNQLILGDQALSLKDFVDAVKRAKMQNGAGPSAATEIYDEKKGVMHKVDRMSAIVHEDFEYTQRFNEIYDRDRTRAKENADLTDGQIYVTEKTLRYMLFGFGKLNVAQSEVLDDIRQGNITKINNEFFGSKTNISHKKLDMIANSLKIVYGDGQTFLKMSATLLSKNAYSVQNERGEWVAREGREGLHNMRVKLEAFEEKEWSEGRGTLGMSVPKSASKMMNKNVMPDNQDMINTREIDPKYTTDLSADFMRLQMINPSNKIEIVDARQIKNLITGEQDLSATVIFNGEEVSVKDLIVEYHKLSSDKLLNNFFAQRNLTFTWSDSLKTLDRVKELNKFVPRSKVKDLKGDLRSFVKYAIAGLEASQAKTQMLSYFQVDEFGNPQYNLNGPMTHDKFEELFLAYFSKGILAGKQPGISAALVSDAHMGVIKQVVQVDETGTPTEWKVVRSDDWENLKRREPSKYNGVVLKAGNGALLHEDLTDHTLKVGDFFMDRLRGNVMEYKDGKATGQRYTEFMMPPHFKSQLQNSVNWNEPLPDSIAKMFGIRIPSQDKHSAVNLKLVDYLPVFMGSSAMYAKELIELSGADFDIDKLYMHIKEFFFNGKDFVEYGKVDNNKDGYKHYIRWVVENATKKSAIRQAIDRWSTASRVITPINTPTVDLYNLDSEELREYYKYITSQNNKIVIDILESVMNGPSLNDAMLEKLYNRAEGLPEALEALSLPVTYEEYLEFKNTNEREPYQAAIDNKILDVKFALLGNKGITDKRKGRHVGLYFEPAVTTPLSDPKGFEQGLEGGIEQQLKKELGDILITMGENELDVDSMLAQLDAWTNNKEGARSIGNVVLPNVIVSILTEYKIQLRKKLDQGPGGSQFPTMNGVVYNSFEHDYEIDHSSKETNPLLARKQFIISALITAMTDNAKLRLASKLGLKKQALANVVTMLGMGVDLKTAILLLNFPTIKEALFHGENKDGAMDPGFKGLLKKRYRNIQERLEGEKDYAVQVNIPNLMSGIQNIQFTREGAYEVEGIAEAEVGQLALELAVIEQYLRFNAVTEATQHASTLLNLQKGLGRDLIELDYKQEAAEELGLLSSSTEFKDSMLPIDLRDIFLKKGSMHNAHYEVFREMYDNLLPIVMLKRTPKFLELKDKVVANLGRADSTLLRQVNRDLVNYLTLKSYMVSLSKDMYSGNSLASLSNSLVYDGNIYSNIDSNSLTISKVVDRVSERLQQEGKTNYFIDTFTRIIKAEHEDNKSGMIKLESNTWTQFSDSELIRVQNSILELLSLDKGDGTMWDDVQHIIHYTAVMSGMSFASGSFANVIPTALTKDILNSVDKVHELFKNREREGAFKGVFDINFDEMVDEFIKGYLKSKGNSFNLNSVSPGRVDVMEVKQGEVIENIGAGTESMTIDYNLPETTSNSKMLSNIAYRRFKFKFTNIGGKTETYEFGSVMHAYQTLKSGSFNKTIDSQYREGDVSLGLRNAAGKMIANNQKRKKGAMELGYLLQTLVEESVLQNLNLTNASSTLLPQVLIHAKKFQFPANDMISKATEKGLLNARKNLRYKVQSEEDKKQEFASREFTDVRKINDSLGKNKNINERSPLFINEEDGTLKIDLFRGIPFERSKRLKRVRFIKNDNSSKRNERNIERRNASLTKLKKAGFDVKWVKIKLGGKDILTPQIKFPAALRVGNRYYMLESVYRDGAYKKDGDINNIIPSDSNIAFGNEANYIEVELEGSSSQTLIAFMFGARPTSNEIVQYGKDKRQSFGEMEITEKDEQNADDLENYFGDEEVDNSEGMLEDEYVDFSEINTEMEEQDNNLELSDEEMLKDFYEGLTVDQQTKLATNEDLGIFSTKDVVSLLNKGENTRATDVIELLKKCYI
jgi:hypothetical protein